MATEAEEKEQTTAEPVVEKPAEPEQKPKKPPKPPKQREILLPILTILFVLVGIAELGLLFVTGFGVFRGSGQGTETGGGAQATEYVLKTPYPPPPWNKPDTSSTGEPEEPVQT